jgi:hypothetical protein
MEFITCGLCHDGGYLDHNVYCDCTAGQFYEDRDELNLQIQLSELDNEYAPVDENWIDEYKLEFESLRFLTDLPFYDGIKITDETEYDDNSEDEYYDMRANSPWISDYEWEMHDSRECGFQCDACAYEDSTW